MKLINKIVVFITAISGIVWFGTALTRQMVYYSFFTPPTLNLRPELTEINLVPVFLPILPVVVVYVVSFGLFIAGLLLSLITVKPEFRKNGWLFIAAVMIFLTLPFEGYLIYNYDFPFIQAANSGSVNASVLFDALLKRLTVLSGFPIIQLCCYAAVVFLVIFKPLTKLTVNNED